MNKGILKRILSYIKPYRIWLYVSLISALIYVFTTLYIPILTGDAINLIVGSHLVDFKKVTIKILFIVGLFILGSIFQWIMAYGANTLSYQTVKDIRKQTINKILNVELRYLDKISPGDIITRVISDVDQVSDGLIQCFQQFLTGIVTIIGTLILMFIICWPIAIAVVVLTPLSMFVASFIAKSSAKSFKEQSIKRGDLGSFSNEYVSNQKIVISYNQQKEAIKKFDEINEELGKYTFKAQLFGALANPSTRFVNAIIYAVLAVGGALLVLNKDFNLSIGSLYSFLTYASHYTKPFNEISGVIAELQNSFASAKRIFAFLDQEEQASDKDNLKIEDVKGLVRLEDVSFSYEQNQKLIEHLSFRAKPGASVAIVGPTGCGKTTLINLLMRFYDPNEGAIKLENYDIRDLTRDSLRESYGMVLQDTWIFQGTIKENIAYGSENPSEEEIIEAAKRAKVHNFVMRMENGYDTIVGGSNDLSEGQRQLLCIARLMLRKPQILILDEATSSLDTRTELIIQQNFRELIKGKTSFIIAHRLSTITEADIILVMKDGNVIEQGTHDELLNKRGFYYELYNAQFAND